MLFYLVSALLISLISLRAEESCLTQEESFITHHVLSIEGRDLSYQATVGSLILKNDNCEPIAKLFFISYTKEQAEQPRPLTFCFNGGPGSSAVWLHMGLAGPKCVVFTEQGIPEMPYRLQDNIHTLLEVTDLVFIDPVSTGFSHAIPYNKAKEFYGVQEDIESIGAFIYQYLSRFHRWDSPKFLLGESYGTTRAAALAEHLHSQAFIDIDGIVLISSVLNFQTLRFKMGNDLPFSLILPSYTAAAWFHQKLPPSLQALPFESVIEQAKLFASTDYTTALFQGNGLPAKQRQSVIENLARFTGLSPSYIDLYNLRIPMFAFAKELLRDQKRTVGRFDSRIQGIDAFAAGESIEYDPSMDLISGAFAATFHAYLQNDLGCTKDAHYEIISDVVFPWNYRCDNAYFNVSEDLCSVVTKYPGMRVFVANGYFDLATPFFATEYTLEHLDLDPTIQQRVTWKNYQGGHMMYTNPSTLQELSHDLRNFYLKP